MESLFLQYLLWPPLGYLLAFLGIIFEGDGTLFTAAFLTQAGFFHLGNMLLVIFGGALLRDAFCYWLGTNIKNSNSVFGRWANRLTEPFNEHLLNNPFRTVLISKFVLGFNYAMLIKSGMLGIKPKEIFRGDVLAVILWVASVGGLGYFSSIPILLLKRYLRFAELTLLAGLVIFFILCHFIKKYSKKKL